LHQYRNQILYAVEFMLQNIKKSKRRRHIRYAIEIEALLVIEAATPLPCIILDFCTEGFFLGFKELNPTITLNKEIKVQFSLGAEQYRQMFEIEAKVVHVTPTGLGVAVENMPVSALNALIKATDNDATIILQDQRRSSPNKLNLVNFKNLLKKTLDKELPLLLEDFFASVSEDVRIANDHTGYFSNQYELDDFITYLKSTQTSFISIYSVLVISQVDYITENNHKNDDIFNADMSLSLVEKDDFEDWLNMSEVIRKLTNHFEERTNQLIREINRIIGYSSSPINNPISPAVLCDCFRETLLQLEVDKRINKTLYQSFGKTIFNSLYPLYDQVEKVSKQYKSADKKTPQIQSPNLKSREIDIHQTQRASNKSHKRANQSEQYPESLDSDVFFDDFDEYQPKNKQPIAQVAGKLIHLLNELDSGSLEIVRKRDDYTQQHPAFSTNELVAAISKLNNNYHDDNTIHLDSLALKNKLNNTLEQLSNQSKSISRKDIHQLEVYGKFFETLFNDLSVSDELINHFEKIHLPLLSLPLQGNDFLETENHPARKILNQLAKLESSLKSSKGVKNKNIAKEVDKLVERIAGESATNINIFSEVEQDLEQLTKRVTKSINSNIKHIVDAYEGQQKLEMAKRAIQNQLDEKLAGKSIPSIIPLLLKSGWQHLLVMAELNKDKNEEESLKYFKAFDDLFFWFYEQDSVLKMQAHTIQSTLDFIAENLSSICTNVAERKNIIDELTALLLGVGTPKVRKSIKTIVMPAVNSKEDTSLQRHDENWLQVEQLEVGDWLMMYSIAEFESMKLIWKSDVIDAYVFVNSDGLNKVELNKAELAEQFRNGAANKLENQDVPIVDRTTNVMLEKMHGKLVHSATHDPETELLTRDEFVKQIKNNLPKLIDSYNILCHIEILEFRIITNICGIEGGKELVKSISNTLKSNLINDEIIARIGDKSFALLLKNCNTDEGLDLAKKLIKQITASHFTWQEQSFSISISMGLVALDNNLSNIHQLLQQADAASMSAEQSGPNHVLLFSSNDEQIQLQNKLNEWSGNIDNVFTQNRLFIRCQKITAIAPSSGKHQHYEILLGIKDETGITIPPDNFIPAVERCKRMPEIDQWVIKNVFEWIDKNKDDFSKSDGFAINLSGQSINDEEFLDFLKAFLRDTSAPLDKITFEITETIASKSIVFTKNFIHAIKEFGCKFSLDDFGSGYSSYSYLKNLDVDYLKIDGAFVKDIANNKADVAIVKSMNEIAHSLGLKTIAEYVENNEIMDILKDIGVDYAQGYGVEKPILLSDLVINAPEAELFYFEDDQFWQI
jgi:diguanylate cyclase (GGDEF)-like protein